MIRINATDRGQGKFITEDGYMVAQHATIARTGVQQYRADELGLHRVMSGVKATDMIGLYRPESEVFAKATLESFVMVPVTLQHPSDAVVTKDNWSQHAKGEVRSVERTEDFMTGTIVVRSADAIAAIDGGIQELSAGYSFDLDATTGVAPDGTPYHAIQRNIRGNHVALVSKARCGSACRIGDTDISTQGGTSMAEKKIIVGGISIEVNDTAASIIEQALTAADAQRKELEESVKALKAEHATALAAKDAELAAARKQIVTADQLHAMVEDRVQTLDLAKRMAPLIVVAGKACDAIHREVLASVVASDEDAKAVVTAILGKQTVADADAAQLKTAFMAMGATRKPVAANDGDTAAGAALAGDGGSGEKRGPVGRDRLMQGMRSGWAGK